MLRLRQVAVVAADLATAEREVTESLGLARCFQDPGVGAFGLHNALFPIGDQFLEIVSPTTEGTTAGRLLEKRAGDGGYMVLFQTDDLSAFRDRFERLEMRVIHEAIDSGIVGLHLHPKDIGGAVVSVDETDDPAEWAWAGPDWRAFDRPEVVTSLAGVEIQTDDPDATAARWGAMLDRPVVDRAIECDDATVRFAPSLDGRGDGVGSFDVVTADTSRVGTTDLVVGTRVNFVL